MAVDHNVEKTLPTSSRILIMTAVEAERDAVLRGLRGSDRFDVRLAGVGPIAAGVNTAKVLASAGGEYGLVVSVGIGGGFASLAEVGSIVVANEIVVADLGAETPEGFCRLDELGFGATRVPVDQSLAAKVYDALVAAKLPMSVYQGAVLTVSTVTGTAETAVEMKNRVSNAAAEAMEGYGVALAAHDRGIPVLEIRSISNPVGPRDRAAWRIKEALEALEAMSAVFLEVF